MSWNYRLVRTKYPKSEVFITEQLLEIKEIYYDKNGKIEWYSDVALPQGETIEEVKESLDLMYKALEKPIVELSVFK